MSNLDFHSNPALKKYQEVKEQLLKEHYGQSVLIVGDEVRAIRPTLREVMDIAISEGLDPNQTIVRRIDRKEETLENPPPEIHILQRENYGD